MLSGRILGVYWQTCGDGKIGERRNSPRPGLPPCIRSQRQSRRIGHVVDECIAGRHDGGTAIAESVNDFSPASR